MLSLLLSVLSTFAEDSYSGVKGDLLLLWCSSRGRRPQLPVPKQGVFKRCLSLLQPWGALPAVQRTADGRHSHQAADGQVSGEGGHPRLSVHTGRTWGAALCEQQKHQAAERLCLSAHHKPFITPVGFWECLFFLRYFEGMASPSSRLLYGIKITKHNPNTAHFSNAFLEINVLSSSPFEMKM